MGSTESKARFNILDVVIVIILIALIAGIFFRNTITGMLNTEKSGEITYTFEIKQVNNDQLSYLTQNTLLTESESGGSMGRIASVTSEKSMITEYGVDGSIFELEKEGYSDVTVKAVANGFKSSSGVYADGNILIVPGKIYTVFSSTSVYTITILSIE